MNFSGLIKLTILSGNSKKINFEKSLNLLKDLLQPSQKSGYITITTQTEKKITNPFTAEIAQIQSSFLLNISTNAIFTVDSGF